MLPADITAPQRAARWRAHLEGSVGVEWHTPAVTIEEAVCPAVFGLNQQLLL